jgi:excisionase family DNA binding protein
MSPVTTVFPETKKFQEAPIVNLLTAKDVADRLGVSALTVIRLADAGTLPAVEVAKRERRRILRFRPETVEKFITSREKRGSGAEVGSGSRNK